MTRQRLKIILHAGLAGCESQDIGKPNVIGIYADDIGCGDISCYGTTAVTTPNADRLAKEGIQFKNLLLSTY